MEEKFYASNCAEDDRAFVSGQLPSCYRNPGSIDNELHSKMYNTLLPLLSAYPGSRWLTVGDGRYGSDAHFLLKHSKSVVSSNINTKSLEHAKNMGWIGDFFSANLEKLPAKDNEFDFLLCKSTYHHLPRPPIGLYEMLRVAKIATVLIEPLDEQRSLFIGLKSLAKQVFRGERGTDYEPSGNFIYRIEIREMEKLLKSLDFPGYAVKKFNTFWINRISDKPAKFNSINYLFYLSGGIAQDMLCYLKLLGYGVGTIVIFKEDPDITTIKLLRKSGFLYERLPRNPYFTKV